MKLPWAYFGRLLACAQATAHNSDSSGVDIKEAARAQANQTNRLGQPKPQLEPTQSTDPVTAAAAAQPQPGSRTVATTTAATTAVSSRNQHLPLTSSVTTDCSPVKKRPGPASVEMMSHTRSGARYTPAWPQPEPEDNTSDDSSEGEADISVGQAFSSAGQLREGRLRCVLVGVPGAASIITALAAPATQPLASRHASSQKRLRRSFPQLPDTVNPPDQDAGLGSCLACCEPFTGHPPILARLQVPCGHTYCDACLGSMFTQARQGSRPFPVHCCSQPFDDSFAAALLGEEGAAMYRLKHEEATCSAKMYCPAGGCGAFINLDKVPLGNTVWSCACGQQLCVTCRSTVHPRLSCAQFQALPECVRLSSEDLGVVAYGKSLGWQICPKCRYMVERMSGCNHIACRCGTQFCYACGTCLNQINGRCACR